MSGCLRQYDYDAILKYIIEFKAEHDGNSPTIREITENCQISSTSVTANILDNLEKEGRLTLGGSGRSRMISIPGGQWSMAD